MRRQASSSNVMSAFKGVTTGTTEPRSIAEQAIESVLTLKC